MLVRSICVIALVALLMSPAHALLEIQALKPLDLKDNVERMADDDENLDLCPTCVSFAGQSINALLNIILQVGVLGSCQELCGHLPAQLEQVVCNLLCDYVGITEFIKIVENADLNPIYFCQLLHVCPAVDDAEAHFQDFTISPASGPIGTTFVMDLVFTVVNKTGAGELVVVIDAPAGMPLSGSSFFSSIDVGTYQAKFNLQAEPSDDQPFLPGTYPVKSAICSGECGSHRPHSYIMDETSASFDITK